MTIREQVKKEIDVLPDEVIQQIQDFVAFQMYRLGMYEDDTAYLNAIPGMMESIQDGIKTPMSDCMPVSKVWDDV